MEHSSTTSCLSSQGSDMEDDSMLGLGSPLVSVTLKNYDMVMHINLINCEFHF